MKKLFLVTFAIVIVAMSVPALGQTNEAAVKNPGQSNMMSQGYSPFRPTVEENNKGIVYLENGVYHFDLTNGSDGLVRRNFGALLSAFRKAHPRLEQESMTPAEMRVYRNEVVVQAYYVTFREKK